MSPPCTPEQITCIWRNWTEAPLVKIYRECLEKPEGLLGFEPSQNLINRSKASFKDEALHQRLLSGIQIKTGMTDEMKRLGSDETRRSQKARSCRFMILRPERNRKLKKLTSYSSKYEHCFMILKIGNNGLCVLKEDIHLLLIHIQKYLTNMISGICFRIIQC